MKVPVKLKPDELDIQPTAPFANCALSRGEIAEALATLLINTPGPYVISLDAPWGGGKTTFLKMFKALLDNKGFSSVYFSAWETDFSVDPLLAFMGEIDELFNSKFPSDVSKREVFKKVKICATAIAKRVIPATIKVATAGVVDLNDPDIKKVVQESAGGLVEDAVAGYIESKKVINDFRTKMIEAIGEISKLKDNLPVVIIVDELDRCRPLYAIELLERVKHLFNIPNAQFIIATDREQLSVSLSGVYGQGFNSREYLRRFFDLDLRLTNESGDAFFESLSSRMNLQSFFDQRPEQLRQTDSDQTKWAFNELSALFQMTPRMQEHFMSLLVLAMRSTPNEKYFAPLQIAVLAALKICEQTIYIDVTRNGATVMQIIDLFDKLQSQTGALQRNHWAVIQGVVLALQNRGDIQAQGFIQALQNKVAASTDGMNDSSVTLTVRTDHQYASTRMDTLSKKLDLAHQFSSSRSR